MPCPQRVRVVSAQKTGVQQPSRLAHGWKAYWRGAEQALFPPLCSLCDRTVESARGTVALCPECEDQLVTDPARLCRRCGVQVSPLVQRDGGCPFCRRGQLRFAQTVTLGPYAGSLRTAIVRMKRPAEQCLTHAVGCLLADRALATSARFELVVAVPAHWSRRLLRGAPPAAQVAEAVARRCNVPYRGRLVRQVRRTRKQSLLDPLERRRNVRAAFQIRAPAEVRRKPVAVVDDIMTTGATLNEIARCLRRAGAAGVTALVVARAERRLAR